MIFNGDQNTLLLQIRRDGLTAFTPVLTLVRSCFFVHRTALIHYVDLRQIVPLTYLEVIWIMSWRDLNRTAAKLFIYILVSDNWNLPADNRQDQRFADQIFITIILRMNSNCRITQHRLRTCGRYSDMSAAIFKWVTQMVQMTVNFLIFNLDIRQRRTSRRVPVDDTFTAIDQAFIIKLNKYLANSLRQTLIEGKTLAGVVKGKSHFSPLLMNGVRVFVFPIPHLLQELLTSEVMSGNPLLAQLLLYLRLCCNTCVVRTWQPKRIEALHPFSTNQDIL
ncbi:hypothetical protein D3C75_560260 [compost metagenome]